MNIQESYKYYKISLNSQLKEKQVLGTKGLGFIGRRSGVYKSIIGIEKVCIDGGNRKGLHWWGMVLKKSTVWNGSFLIQIVS